MSFTPPGEACSRSETFHDAAPPPASVTFTGTRRVVPTRSSPSDTTEGLTKTSGLSAAGRLTSPPPSRVVSVSPSVSGSSTGLPVWTSADVT